jgi:uncharacterized protein
MTSDEADRLIYGLAEAAKLEPSWRALAVVGSWARGTASHNSDLDLLVLSDRIETWVASDAWLRTAVTALGFDCTSAALEDYGVAKSWRAWLAPNVELELTLAPLSWAKTKPIDSGTRQVVRDGMVPVVDKVGLLRSVQDAVRASR